MIDEWLTRKRSLALWTAVVLCSLLPASAVAQTCATPGRDGSGTISGIVNTYYPPSGAITVSAGSTSIALGPASVAGANVAIAPGDLVVIMQMQNATLNSTDTSNYGAGTGTGTGSTGGTAGQYEFAVATRAVPTAGGTLQLTTGLLNTYTEAAATSTTGQFAFQVIRVPQYAGITLGAVTAPAWNGDTGGVVVMDVDAALTLGGGSINVNGLGFRGGGGVNASGGPGSTADYLLIANQGDGGSKGEGIAGTPRFIASSTTTVLDNTTEGYPNGSFDRGAPGNAGGGGTDGDPVANDQNSGGGGGGNGGGGGKGGFSWNSGLDVGGVGGSAFVATAAKLVMGGGGGASTMNNNAGADYLGSGAPGGGIVIVRAGTVTGTGTVNANGSTAQNINQDGAGGGGAGGSIIFTAKTGTLPATLSLNANGGGGGSSWIGTAGAANAHGPGGGGGGGAILQSGGATTSVTGGAHGQTTTGLLQYGSVSGTNGTTAATTSAALPGAGSGAQCLALVEPISGYVYSDLNHNGNLDPGESWTSGVSVYVNLVRSGAVWQSLQVNAGTGAYNFTNVAAGSYTIVVTNSNAATAASAPSGWVAVVPTNLTLSLTVGSAAFYNQDFGLFHGLAVSGEVFKDTGAGSGGVANDGHLNGTEPGLYNVSLTAKDSGSVLLGQTTTDGGGNYTLWLPSTAVNPVTITLSKIGNNTATGFDAGAPATGGTYNTTTLVFSFSATWTNTAYSGVNFGFIQSGNIFAPNGQQTTVPGSMAIYAHQYTSVTGGTVTFTEAAAQSQPNYFNEVLYNDTTCTGNLAAATYLAWGTAVTIPAGGGKVCLLMKEMVSLASTFGIQNTITITSAFSYGSSSSVASTTLTISDLTTLDMRSSGDLQLVKSTYIDTTCANPASPVYLTTTQAAQSGYCIKYQIQATNGGSSALSGLNLNDTAPPYTTLQSGTPAASVGSGSSCTGLAAPSLGAGTITITGSAVQATFSGTMPAGCVATFVYEVKLN
jgi:SdrD B-like domain